MKLYVSKVFYEIYEVIISRKSLIDIYTTLKDKLKVLYSKKKNVKHDKVKNYFQML